MTAATFFVLLAVLALSYFSFVNVTKGEKDLSEVGVLDRVNYKFTNIEDNYLDLREHILGVTVTVDGNSVCIRDKLPNSNFQPFSGGGDKISHFESELFVYDKFVKLYPDDLNIVFDVSDVNVSAVSAYPLDIAYFYGQRRERQININPFAYAIAGIDVEVVLENQDFDETDYVSPKVPATSSFPGSDLVRLHVYETKGVSPVFDDTIYLDPTLNNKVRVETVNENPPLQHNFMTLQWKDEVIQFISTPNQNLDLTICILLDDAFVNANGSPELTLPPGTLSVSDSDFNTTISN